MGNVWTIERLPCGQRQTGCSMSCLRLLLSKQDVSGFGAKKAAQEDFPPTCLIDTRHTLCSPHFSLLHTSDRRVASLIDTLWVHRSFPSCTQSDRREASHILILCSVHPSLLLVSCSNYTNMGSPASAFLIVLAAGLATALGAVVVLIPSLRKYATRKALAASLSFAAGVMIYVSFVEILQKSHTSFLKANVKENVAYSLSTLCFFSGIAIMMVRAWCCCS